MAKQFTTMDVNVRDFFAKLKEDSNNKYCIDCGAANPQWASVSFGIFFCLECSGIHRSYGSHISFVRSLTMDAWKDRELRIMQLGGNANCVAFYKKNGISDLKGASMKEKWCSPIAEEYRQRIKALADGKDPNKVSSSSSSSSSKKSSSAKKDDWDWAEEPAKTSSPTSKSKLSGSAYKSPAADVSNPYSTYQSGGVKTYEGFGSDSVHSSNSSAYKGFGSDSIGSSGGYNSSPYGGSSPSYSSSPSSKSSSSKKNGSSSSSSSSRESERKSSKNRESSISDEKLSKFKGQQAISSAEYFGEDQESDGFRSNNSGSGDLFKSLEESWNKLSVVAVNAAAVVGEKVTAENTSKWASWAQEGVMDYWSKLQAVATGSEAETNRGSPSSQQYQQEESSVESNSTPKRESKQSRRSHRNDDDDEVEEEKKLDDWLSDEKPKKSSKGSSKSKSKSVKEENNEEDWGEVQSPKPKTKSKKSSKIVEKEVEGKAKEQDEWDNWGSEAVESATASKPKKKESTSRKKIEEGNDWDKWDSQW
eukprot:TRINITY_DN2664_c0_g1_i1.p1 TRINITY_DN2664_c0_g1~~TRINITY_DN2664_c0_g1_i1.p1  ORF type:complete len:533 (+),score=219.07 TRINITY_DN2664_c0_g1_i1:116-1714(+)